MANLLTNVIIWAYGKYRDFFKISDYAVSKVYLEYYVDLDMKYEIDTFDDFWVHEKTHYWDEGESDFYIDVTNREFSGTEVPQNVTKTIFRVHYWYNNERYKYITYDPEFTWPPKNNTTGVSFNLPITSATLVDEDDKPVRDVTRKVKRYAGPKGDFHGSDVKLSDLLFYDEDVLAEKYPKIQITNALGVKKVVSTLTGTTMNLRSP
jgi:hypothetical protein